MFIALLLPLIPLVVVPVGLAIVFSFRHQHGCDACTAQSYSCARHESGKSCPFFD
jgi:hypothetical protein